MKRCLQFDDQNMNGQKNAVAGACKTNKKKKKKARRWRRRRKMAFVSVLVSFGCVSV